MIRSLFTVTVMLIVAVPSAAEEDPLRNYVELALEQNLQLGMSRADVEAARNERAAAAGAIYPTVALESRFTRINRAATLDVSFPPGFGIEIPEIIGVWQGQAGVQLRAPVYLGGTLRRNLELSDSVLRATEFQVDADERQVELVVVSAYLDIKMAKALEEVQGAALETARKHESAVAAMLEQGMVSLRELKRAEAVVAEAERQVISAENTVELARRAFNFILNRGLEADVDLSGELGWDEEYRLEQAVENALRSRPELSALAERLIMGDKRIDLARAAYRPSFYVAAEGGIREGDIQSIAGRDYWSVSVLAQINLFDASKGDRLAATQASRRREDLLLEQTRKRIELEVTDNYLRLIEARKRFSVSEREQAAAEEARRVADLQFLQGVIDQVTYLDAELALTAARVHVEQARYLALKAEAALRHAAGFTLP